MPFVQVHTRARESAAFKTRVAAVRDAQCPSVAREVAEVGVEDEDMAGRVRRAERARRRQEQPRTAGAHARERAATAVGAECIVHVSYAAAI
eukprot:66530-Pleurochrysis_carterae.AAC.2